MAILGLQERLNLFQSANYSQRISKKQSPVVLGAIIFVHAAIILLAFNEKMRQREFVPEKILHMINVLPEQVEPISEPDKPEINEPRPLQLTAPHIQIAEPVSSPLDLPLNNSPYVLHSETSGQYEHIFDPKLRKKLIDAQSLNVRPTAGRAKNWIEADGRTFVDVGDGNCFVSMAQVDARERETNWGMTKCGKTDSEKMMDNMNADLEARKHPLNKKGQQ